VLSIFEMIEIKKILNVKKWWFQIWRE